VSLYDRIEESGPHGGCSGHNFWPHAPKAADLNARYTSLGVEPMAFVYGVMPDGKRAYHGRFTGDKAKKEAETWLRGMGRKKSGDVFTLKATALKKKVNAENKAKKKAEAERARQIELWGGQKKLDALVNALANWARWAGGNSDQAKFRINRYGGKVSSAIETGIRDYDLPKEGAYDMGYADYDALVAKTIKGHMKTFKQKVAPYMPNNATLSVSDGEKSWLYFSLHPGKAKPRGFGKPKIK
jgi:hypothetical protein